MRAIFGGCSLRGSSRARSATARVASWRASGKDRVFGHQRGTELAHREQVEKPLLGKAMARPDLVRQVFAIHGRNSELLVTKIATHGFQVEVAQAFRLPSSR